MYSSRLVLSLLFIFCTIFASPSRSAGLNSSLSHQASYLSKLEALFLFLFLRSFIRPQGGSTTLALLLLMFYTHKPAPATLNERPSTPLHWSRYEQTVVNGTKGILQARERTCAIVELKKVKRKKAKLRFCVTALCYSEYTGPLFRILEWPTGSRPRKLNRQAGNVNFGRARFSPVFYNSLPCTLLHSLLISSILHSSCGCKLATCFTSFNFLSSTCILTPHLYLHNTDW